MRAPAASSAASRSSDASICLRGRRRSAAGAARARCGRNSSCRRPARFRRQAAAASATDAPACGRGSADRRPSRRRTRRARRRPDAICGRDRNRAGRSRCRAAISGSMPASHSRRCTSIVAFGISALPPQWSKWKCELITSRSSPGSRPIARAGRRSPRRDDSRTRTARQGAARAAPAGSCWQSGCIPVSNSAVPFGCSIR